MRAENSRVVFPRKTTMNQSNCSQLYRTPTNCKTTKETNIKQESKDKSDDVLELEKRIQCLSFDGDKNIKVEEPPPQQTEEPDEVELLTKSVKSLEVKEEDGSDAEDDRIPRGPEKTQRVTHAPSTPYQLKTSPARLHHSGGQLVSTTSPPPQYQDCSNSFSIPPQIPFNNYSASYNVFPQYHQNLGAENIIELPSILSGCQATASSSTVAEDSNVLFQDLSFILDESSTSTHGSIDDIVQEILPELEIKDMAASEIDFLVRTLEKNNETEEYIEPTIQNELNIPTTHQYICGQNGMNIPQPSSSSPEYYAINSVTSIGSSGYESSTSTPSNSPGPNNVSTSPPNISYTYNIHHQNFSNGDDDIPITVQDFSSSLNTQTETNLTKYRPILPKIKLVGMQNKFKNYIIHLAKSEQAINRIIGVIYKNDISIFTLPDVDGDTALIKLVANPTAVALEASSGADFLKNMSPDPQVVRLAVIYAVVQRLDMDSPMTLKHKNNVKQSALHLAAINSPEHPLIAAYIAETMHKHRFNLNERCEDQQCKLGGTLLHCLAHRGDSHAAVLGELLKVPGAFVVDALDINNRMTPLQLAIRSLQENLQGPLRVHKTVDVLIKNGASLKAKEKGMMTPLQMVLQGTLETGCGPDMDLIKVLLDNPRNEVNTADTKSLKPIHYAAMLTNKVPMNLVGYLMNLLIQHGAAVKNDANWQFNILQMTKDDQKEAVRQLLFPLQKNQSM